MTFLEQALALQKTIEKSRRLFDVILDVHNETEVEFRARALGDVMIMAGNDVRAMIKSIREDKVML